mmetsp:Transcript_12725/g.18770  ORF Transcript_12725/g.18770 Transcript_12725/m.18770 type:complete len:110 (-) Transcript_12725:209-538(-)
MAADSKAGSSQSKSKDQLLGAPQVLGGSDWRLGLDLGDSRRGPRRCDPFASLDLHLTKPAPAVEPGTASDPTTTKEDEETLTIDFSHEELYDFFSKLERIQFQLDQLGC